MYISKHLCFLGQKLVCTSLLLFAFHTQAAIKPDVPELIDGATKLTAEQVIELILSKPDLLLIDSRKKAEYIKGHIEGAINILNTQLTQNTLHKLVTDKSNPVIFYCNGHQCMRSAASVKMALSWGYNNIYWFRGGWQEWSEKRLPAITE